MKTIRFNLNPSLTFRQWSRKRYSLFNIIRRSVKIAVLSIVYHSSTAMVSDSISVVAPDSIGNMIKVELDEIEVGVGRAPELFSESARILTVLTSNQLKTIPATSLSDALKYVTGVDIRQRGPEGIQADISIRGGTFDQTLILLNGINITDPQTGHHNLNIPLNLTQVSRIEVLEGPASRIYGPNAFSGAINIITSPEDSPPLSITASYGNYNSLSVNISGHLKTGQFSHLISTGHKSSDGHIINTDFKVSDLFIHSSGNLYSGKIDFQAGYSMKDFGAQAFYTPKYPDQFEATRTFLTSLRFTTEGKVKLSPFIYWRKNSDRFELFRNEAPEWYKGHNYHVSEVFGSGINAWFNHRLGRTSIGSEIRSEGIMSNVLGEPMNTSVKVMGEQAFYTKSALRSSFSMFVENRYRINRISLSFGLLAQKNSSISENWRLYPGVDASYQISPFSRIFVSGGQSLRLPTFTDLYYSGPTNQGNPHLRPEEVIHFEIGWKGQSPGIQAHGGIFHQKGRNLIDWIREADNSIWRTANHTRINGTGFQTKLSVFPDRLLNKNTPVIYLTVGYHYNFQKKKDQDLISYYTLDFVRHKGTVQLEHRLIKNLSINWGLLFQDRNGTYTGFSNNLPVEMEYRPFWLADSKITYSRGKISANIHISNLLDVKYYDFGNIIQPGRSFRGTISITMN
ncbi:outer membrane cobalamin receptor protein [Bacteroidales bacterium 6E]|nr:outer membrane cobalamin receptor protein [Bacteroidales bacterium 6E]